MTTIGESIARLREKIKASSEDAFVTDRYLYSKFISFAKALIRRQDNEKKIVRYDSLFELLPFVELIEVDKIEANCAGIKTGCKIMRTKEKLPKVFQGSLGPIFRNIGPIDGSDTFQQINPGVYTAMTHSTNFKYNKCHYFWFRNGYLYFPDIKWEAVQIEAMFENPIDAFCNPNDTDCTIMQHKDLNLPEYLIAEIEGMAAQDILSPLNIPSDTNDDSININR